MYVRSMPIYWNLTEIDRLMRKRGIASQAELNRRADVSRLTMYNISRSGSLTRIDVPVLEGLAKALGAPPLSLLEHRTD